MVKNKNSRITMEKMNVLLAGLSDKLVDNNTSMEIVLCGGAVMLIYGVRDMTAP